MLDWLSGAPKLPIPTQYCMMLLLRKKEDSSARTASAPDSSRRGGGGGGKEAFSRGSSHVIRGGNRHAHAERGERGERSIASSSSLGAWAGLAYERSSFGIESGRINEKVALFRVPFSFSFSSPPPSSLMSGLGEDGLFVAAADTGGAGEREGATFFMCLFVHQSFCVRSGRWSTRFGGGGRSPFSLIPRFARGPINVDCRCS